MVYDARPTTSCGRSCDAKVDSQFARAMRYVEAVGARAVVPSAGPPCFLDPELFHLNVITGDEPSIFPDQRVFLERLADGRPPRASWRSPAPTIDVDARRRSTVTHPFADDDVRGDLRPTRPTYLARYQADWLPWLDELQGRRGRTPTTRPAADAAGVVGAAAGDGPDAARRRRRDVPAARRRRRDRSSTSPPARSAPTPASRTASASTSHRALVETVVAERAVDWSNSLFLSCRFRAWREGEFNEYLYNFFKSLSRRADAPHRGRGAAQARPADRDRAATRSSSATTSCSAAARTATPTSPCSARSTACELICTLHGWRFDLETGRCLTAADHPSAGRAAGDG